eukprot:COSAG01_NODE_5442_length_4262_cov_31.153015_3_plen_48_part_00
MHPLTANVLIIWNSADPRLRAAATAPHQCFTPPPTNAFLTVAVENGR